MTSVTSSREALSSPLSSLSIMDASDIASIAWQPVPECEGVAEKVLWHLGGFTEALIRFAPGASTPGRPHLAAHHHVWVVSGELTLVGRRLTAGSYVHVPPGVEHSYTAGPEGCVVLQMHRPHPPHEADLLAGG